MYNNNSIQNRWKCCCRLLFFVGMISKPRKESAAPVNFIQSQIQQNTVFSSIFFFLFFWLRFVLFFCFFSLWFPIVFTFNRMMKSTLWTDAQTQILSATVIYDMLLHILNKIWSAAWQNDELNQFSLTHAPNLKALPISVVFFPFANRFLISVFLRFF